MSLFKHDSFTIDLNKIIAVYQDDDEGAVTIRTDDQRKLEVATSAPEAATELLNQLADQWERAVGPLLRHGRHIYLTSAIYSIQVEGLEVYIYFRDHSVSFTSADPQQAVELLAELSVRWAAAIGEGV
jgi:hypothetical protein